MSERQTVNDNLQNNSPSVIAIFDVGKTNKKLFLFNENYRIIHEQTTRFDEIKDEDGDACDDLVSLTSWINTSIGKLMSEKKHDIAAINFSSFGASFVHLDDNGKPFLPLYSYLKPFPPALKNKFFDTYGGEEKLTRETASPVLDHLNSGLQLYRLKHERGLTERKGFSLHLPQYLSSLVTGKYYSDITSIGCHTMLWNYQKGDYHEWVKKENIDRRLAPVLPCDAVLPTGWKNVVSGAGLHDSSSALIPYLAIFNEPFVLISTGTWSISMNPFNDEPLTDDELQHDCLCFLSYQHKPVKAARVFAGHEHEEQAKRIAAHFNLSADFTKHVKFNAAICERLVKTHPQDEHDTFCNGKFAFGDRGLAAFETAEDAYHQLVMDIMHQQALSTNLVMNNKVSRIFVDGGFVRNDIYMNLLARAYPRQEVYAATVAQASAIGAAMAIHRHWNPREMPASLIELRKINA